MVESARVFGSFSLKHPSQLEEEKGSLESLGTAVRIVPL